MTPQTVRQKILKMRASGHSWEEIAEATKLPKTTCVYHARQRYRSRYYNQQRTQKQQETLRKLRAKVQWLEAKLERRQA